MSTDRIFETRKKKPKTQQQKTAKQNKNVSNKPKTRNDQE